MGARASILSQSRKAFTQVRARGDRYRREEQHHVLGVGSEVTRTLRSTYCNRPSPPAPSSAGIYKINAEITQITEVHLFIFKMSRSCTCLTSYIRTDNKQTLFPPYVEL